MARRSNKSGKRSKRRSPRKSSSKRSKRRSPRKSRSKRSKRRSPRKSRSKRSKRRSPRKSRSKRSKRRSPRKSSRKGDDAKIIAHFKRLLKKYGKNYSLGGAWTHPITGNQVTVSDKAERLLKQAK